MSQYSIQAKDRGSPDSSSGASAGTSSPSMRRERSGSGRQATPTVSPELPELKEVAELIGGFIEYWGFKAIHGRIWTHLFTSNRPLDATTLVKRLKVSKALVSFAVRDLLEHRVIQEVSRGPRGTVLLRANPDLTGVIAGVLRVREREMLARIRSASAQLEAMPREAHARNELDSEKVRYLGELVRSAESLLELALAMTRAPETPANGDLLSHLQQIQNGKD